MKSPFDVGSLLLASAAFIPSAALAALPITPVGGTFVYTQNFNSLFMATVAGEQVASPAWTDDLTLPGWILYRAGAGTVPLGAAGTNFAYYGHNGGANSTGKFLAMGQVNNPDRALGGVPITAGGEMSQMVVFQNTGATPVDLTRMKYNIEVLRENQGAGAKETLFVWWKKGASQSEFTTNTAELVTAAPTIFVVGTNCSGPSSSYIPGWNRFLNGAGAPDFEWTYTSPNGVLTTATTSINVTQPVDAVPTVRPRLAPGEFLALRWSNINDSGADAVMGLDDLEITFQELNAALVPTVTPSRQVNSTPQIPGDDTVSLSIQVAGTGAVGTRGWKITQPASLATTAGPYGTGAGTPVVVGNIPIADFSGPNKLGYHWAIAPMTTLVGRIADRVSEG